MATLNANGIKIEYELQGDSEAPTVLLVMGLGGQMTAWSDEFMTAFVDAGFQVLRFDNRDIGLSQHFDEAGIPVPGSGEAPYSLSDMAQDAASLMDALEIEDAHVVGASMGGMIIQRFAAEHPDKVRSLTPIMTSTGDPSLPQAAPEILALLGGPVETDRDKIIEGGIERGKIIGSTAFHISDDVRRARGAETYDRSYHPAGQARQMAAIGADGSRREICKTINTPTLVIHGDIDPLVPVTGGQDVADHIPNAEILIIEGMGHDLAAGAVVWEPILMHLSKADAARTNLSG